MKKLEKSNKNQQFVSKLNLDHYVENGPIIAVSKSSGRHSIIKRGDFHEKDYLIFTGDVKKDSCCYEDLFESYSVYIFDPKKNIELINKKNK